MATKRCPSASSSDQEYVCKGTPNSGPHPYTDDPRILTSCLHTFCRSCLNDRVASDTIECPICTESIPLDKESGVDGLQVDVRLVHEIKAANIIKKAKSSSPIKCQLCIKDPPVAVAYCIHHELFICSNCKNFGHNMKEFADHSIIEINHLTVSCLKSKMPFCSCHKKEQLNVYCKECRVLDCHLCFNANHHGHTAIAINDMFESSKEELKLHLSPLNEAILTMQSSLVKNAKAKNKLGEETQITKANIEEAFKAVFDALQKRKEELLQELQRASSAKGTRLERRKKDLEKELEKMNSSVQIVKSRIDTYTPDELVLTSDTLKAYLEKKISSYNPSITMPLSDDNSKVSFAVDKDVLMMQIGWFGKVETSVDPCSSVITGKQVAKGIASKTHAITLESKNAKGERYNKGGDVVDVILKSNSHSIEGTVVDKGNGQYELTYTPPSPGKYQLHVTINDQHIKNSPFALIVRPYRDYREMGEPVSTYNIADNPHCVCTSSDGAIYVSCNTTICKYDSNGTLMATIGKDEGTMKFAQYKGHNWGIAVKGDSIYVANEGKKEIIQLSTNGKFVKTFGAADTVSHIAVNEEDKVYVSVGTYVYVYTSNGALIKKIHCGGKRIYGIALDPSGDIHVVAMRDGLVFVYNPAGEFLRQYGEGVLKNPFGIAIDEEGYCLVSEHRGTEDQLKIFDQQGQLVHSLGNFQFSTGVCIDNKSSVFVVSQVDQQILKY